jgi:hypothetical protein
MSDESHKTASFLDPHPASAFGYLKAGWDTIAASTPPFSPQPAKVIETADPLWLRRCEQTTQLTQDVSQRKVIADLIAAGMPPERFEDPVTPELSAYIEDRAAEYHRALINAYDATANVRSPIRTQSQIIAGVVWLTPKIGSETARYQRAAELLNDGIPRGEEGALNSHHVRRAHRSYEGTLFRAAYALERKG